jgi:hypothetical protein
MKKEWTDLGISFIAAFDGIKLTALLQTMRGLDLFRENSLYYYLGISLQNKLRVILDPLVKRPVPPKRRATNQPLRRMAA